MKRLFKIEGKEDAGAEQSILLVEIGEGHCSFATIDMNTKALQQLGYYGEGSATDVFSQMLNENPVLKGPFSQILVGYDLPGNMILPADHIPGEELDQVVSSFQGLPGEMIVSDVLEKITVKNIYPVPVTLHQLVTRVFPHAKSWQAHTAIIECGPGFDAAGTMMVNIKSESFNVTVGKEKNLLLAQSYQYTTAADVLYYLLEICEQFGLAQNQVQVQLFGLIDPQSNVYAELKNYFLHLSLLKPPATLAIEPSEDYHAHFFTALFNLLPCAS
jgi:hypothetical protein